MVSQRGPVVLSLCDYSGVMVKPWAEAGYECWCVDIRNGETKRLIPNVTWLGSDLRRWKSGWEVRRPDQGFVIVFAFPPCTHLAVSGARWWKGKGLHALAEAVDLVACCADICEVAGAPWMIENPIGSLSTYWREPDAKFDPCDYGGYLEPEGDAYTKRTCLWTGNGFVVPIPRPVFPYEGSRMHLLPPSEDRPNLRSETPAGFARAVFEANSKPTISEVEPGAGLTPRGHATPARDQALKEPVT